VGRCVLCGRSSPLVSGALGVCAGCLRRRPGEALRIVRDRRASWRRRLYRLPRGPLGAAWDAGYA
jgi:pyruvate formate lyase activating enzyme